MMNPNPWRTWLIACVVVLLAAAGFRAAAQATPQQQTAVIDGTVTDSSDAPAAGVRVQLNSAQGGTIRTAETDDAGNFNFSGLAAGQYTLRADAASFGGEAGQEVTLTAGGRIHVTLKLNAAPKGAAPNASQSAMQFSDEPGFTVAGVTDQSAGGGHGSDVTRRASEDLARETIVLKPADATATKTASTNESTLRAAAESHPGDFAANHQIGALYLKEGRDDDAVRFLEAAQKANPQDRTNTCDLAVAYAHTRRFAPARDLIRTLMTSGDTGDLHRLMGEVDEESNDPLAAVHEYETAVRLEPNEPNYFAWGSELLLHKALDPAVDVLTRGAQAFPRSSRMLAALGAALFANGRYAEAARNVCRASDLDPASSAPYVFLGKIEMAAPTSEPCVREKLERFLSLQPDSADANYYLAMVLAKEQKAGSDQKSAMRIVDLLAKAVALNPHFADAAFQLGNMYSEQGDSSRAIDFYTKAITADPSLSAAHYRLGLAYQRSGHPDEAKREFQLHTEIDKRQTAQVERQRQEIKQFLVVLKNTQQPSAQQ
jgi:tetratricopeptide (TPR) repeat protein